ncbi:MAG: outer rane immunogenic protein [Sphingomonadales bacterium]|jgi:outer membrane immunogenic protein|nr:outer rane immunogenic protein [Sphingomonadales bacterium]
MRKYLLAALCAGTLATSAFAQDQGNLGGFRVEAIGGYDRPSVEDENASGVVYGVGVGYDFQSGGALFGIEAEATDSTADERRAGFLAAGDELRVRAGRDFYVGGRVGAVVGGGTLLYAKAGYTNARVRIDYEDGTAGTLADFTDRANLDGVRAGAGAQFAIGSNAYLKTEYRYSNYQDGVDRHQLVGGLGFRF